MKSKNYPPRSAFMALVLAGSLAALFSAPPAKAAILTWSGATNTWNTATNWVGDAVPANNDSLVFGAAGAGGVLLNNNRPSFTVAAMTFSEFAPAYVIGDGTTAANAGNSFVLNGNVTNNSVNLQTLNTPFITAAVRQFWANYGDMRLTGNISGTNGGIQKRGTRVLAISGTNSYAGTTHAQGGVLLLNSANAVPGGIGVTGGTSAMNFNTGVVGLGHGDFTRSLKSGVDGTTFAGNGGWAAYGADRVVNLGGAADTITWQTATTGFNAKTLILGASSSTHTVDLQNPIDLGSVARVIQVDNGSATIDGKLSGNLTGVAGGNLTKGGYGGLVLSGDNDYAGTTSINQGLVRVDGNHTGSGAVTVASSGALGGSGTLNGAVTANVGNFFGPAGLIDLRDGAVGQLTLGSTLTFSGTAAFPIQLYFDLGNAGDGTDRITAAGKITATTANAMVIHLNQLPGTPINPGTYPLIEGGATSTGSGYVLATTRAGGNVYTLDTFASDTQSVTVAAGDPGAADDFAYWQGDTAGWNSAQWYSDAAGTVVAPEPGYNSNARFGTSTAGNLATTLGRDYEINSLTVDAGLAATSIGGSSHMLSVGATAANANTAGNGITVNNVAGTTISTKVGLTASQTWTVAAGAALTVSGQVSDFGASHSLTKAGDGILRLTSETNFSGALEIAGGTFEIGGAARLGGWAYFSSPIINNGTLSFNSTGHQGLPAEISGTGQLIKSGTADLNLSVSAANTYTGGTIISGGSITALGNTIGTGPVTIHSGGKLAVNAGPALTNSLTLNGGTLQLGFWNTVTGPVTLTATSTIATGTGIPSINSVISGEFGLISSGTLALNGENTYSGPTVISRNLLQVASLNRVSGGRATSNLGAPTTVADGTLAFGSATLTGNLSYTGPGETTDRIIELAGSTGGATLTQFGTQGVYPAPHGEGGLLKFTADVAIPGVAGTDNRKTLTLTHATSANIGATPARGEISGSIGDSMSGTPGQLATSVTKAGMGRWTLSGTNNYSGATRVQAGVLAFTRAGALGGGTLDITTGAMAQLDYVGTRQIAALTFDAGSARPDGTYGSSASLATHKDDSRFAGIGTVTVGPIASPTTTTLALTVGGSPSNGGDALTFTATVAGAAPTGDVVFYDGLTVIGTRTLDGSYQASLTTSYLTGGTHAITALYLGAVGNSSSSSAPLAQTVTEGRPATATTLALTGGTNPSASGTAVTFTATVAGAAATGEVVFYHGMSALGTAALNGSGLAALTTSGLPVGWCGITARYLGDAGHAPSTSGPALFQTVNPPAGNGKVKVFILAGQSNMVAYGTVEPGRNPNDLTGPLITGGLGSLRNMLNREPGKYGYLADPANLTAEGNPGFLTRGDVWVSYWGESNGENRRGILDANFGAGGGVGRIGPEYGFGLQVGSQLGDQVLIIKYAFGGKSLNVDFRSPSSGGAVGAYYTGMIARVNQVLGDLESFFPGYDGQGYEISGFGWHQGWNDKGLATATYEGLLVNLIKDLRTEFEVPGMPVSIANTGMANSACLNVLLAQLNVANPALHPEFAGTVACVDTRPFDYGTLLSPSSDATHWNHNGESLFNVGESMGKNMVAMLPASQPGLSPFETWADDPAQGLTAGVNDGPTDDPDEDSITNLMEFVLGGAPMVSSTSILPVLSKPAAAWAFEYDRSHASRPPATTQEVEYGDDLSGWTSVVIPLSGVGNVTIAPGASSDHVTVTLPAMGTKGFVRLKVSQ